MAALDFALAEALEGLPPEDAKALKLVFGKVMAEICDELINPAIKAFSELEPSDSVWSAIAKSRAALRVGSR